MTELSVQHGYLRLMNGGLSKRYLSRWKVYVYNTAAYPSVSYEYKAFGERLLLPSSLYFSRSYVTELSRACKT